MFSNAKKLARKVSRYLGPTVPDVVLSVRQERLSYLTEDALEDLFKSVVRIEKEKLPGRMIEAGCALGGSAIVAAHAKSKPRPFFIYDVFDMIPPPSEEDGEDIQARYETIVGGQSAGIGGDTYYGYEKDLFNKVVENFDNYGIPLEQNNINLVKGLFEDTLHVDEPVALAHIDGDWYGSVKTCLQRIEPRLVSGGRLIVDDYHHWSGCRKAVDEYFQDKMGHYDFKTKSRLHIIRK